MRGERSQPNGKCLWRGNAFVDKHYCEPGCQIEILRVSPQDSLCSNGGKIRSIETPVPCFTIPGYDL